MSASIAIMNTKGGVGKSTVALALAETLSVHADKRILVIDSDSQMSLSSMIQPLEQLCGIRDAERTLFHFLSKSVVRQESPNWQSFVCGDVSNVDEAESIWLLQGHSEVMLLERLFSERNLYGQLRRVIRAFLLNAKNYFDLIFIDCSPGISVLTETWLREADYYLSPVKPDYLAVGGLQTLNDFKRRNPEIRFAGHIGVLINMYDKLSEMDETYCQFLMKNADNRCFSTVIHRAVQIQKCSQYFRGEHSYLSKYPGDIGQSFRALSDELLVRLEQKSATNEASALAAE